MKIRFFSYFLVVILLISLISFSCSSSAAKIPVPFTPVPGATPTVQITQPANNAVINGNLSITVDFSNFAMVDPNGADNIVGQGHLDFCILNAAPDTQSTQSGLVPPTFVISGGGSCAMTAGSYVLENNLAPGDYQLKAELVNNDDTELNPPVIDTILITVGSGSQQVNLNIYQK